MLIVKQEISEKIKRWKKIREAFMRIISMIFPKNIMRMIKSQCQDIHK